MDYISSLSFNGSKTAKVNYEANVWVAHEVSDIWAKISQIKVWLLGLYGQCVDLGFVVIYGSITLIHWIR
ncbi:alpha-L-fucosidase [Trifolium repens]|nr:alpha-L-fucosidase [Trifolium repens]